MTKSYNELHSKPPLKTTDVGLRLMSPGSQVNAEGEMTLKTTYRGRPYAVKTIVVEGTNSNLLSRGVESKMSLVQRIDEVEIVFGTTGVMETEPVRTHLKDDAQPYAVMTVRRVPFPIQQKVEEELNRLEKHGVVIPMKDPSEWCALMVRPRDEEW